MWDPSLIFAQMVTMQGLYYVTLGFWLVLVDLMSGTDRTTSQIFSYEVRKDQILVLAVDKYDSVQTVPN